jgi:hypothetical protein
MKPTIRYIEDPTHRSRMRNSQHSRSRYIPIINQRPSIETIADRDKAMTCQGSCQAFVIPLDP